MFIDKARIYLHAGDGGRGCVSFRREKFVPRGGPNGGDGGKGGDIYFRATASKNTLLDFHYQRHFKSGRGAHGKGSQQTGRSAEDLIIPVPLGTVVYDAESGQLLADLEKDGEEFLAARGGRGGRGNTHFVTSTAQAPHHAEDGTPGEERVLDLELKLIADVGLIGLPNAGKSTLLSKISAAKPKIADYPFTTLSPLLGTVRIQDHTFVVADIPGLIEGASHGAGLGLDFLRHIERTRILLHLVDVSGLDSMDAVQRLELIQSELHQYGKGLIEKPQIVVATKIDSADPDRLQNLKQFCERNQLPFAAISAVTGTGLDDLLSLVMKTLKL